MLFEHTRKSPFTPSVSVNAATTLDDASKFVLIGNSGVTPKWSFNPFSNDIVVFNENRIAGVIAALTLMFGVNRDLKAYSKLQQPNTTFVQAIAERCTFISGVNAPF